MRSQSGFDGELFSVLRADVYVYLQCLSDHLVGYVCSLGSILFYNGPLHLSNSGIIDVVWKTRVNCGTVT